MARYIDAELLKKNCKITGEEKDNFVGTDLRTLGKVIDNQPTADVKEVVNGKNVSSLNPVDEFKCSNCGIMLEDWIRIEIDEHDNDKSYCEFYFNFCPNCGANMRGEK